ncbi:unnamed protein product [Cylicocyclus nassatus]|uniref:Ground-like domain-containing protein n=1 Tax=Cylicocyclus nassatus TaxID=53992 RepID=A0AA36H6E9_CYLNA|nr:unnamed protein product [Cylicocyclus nassatus]
MVMCMITSGALDLPYLCCGGCGRRKREATNLLTAGGKKCNSEELQTILRENVKNDVNSSIVSIREKMANFHDYALVCDDKKLEFIVEADDYCQHQSENVFCAVFTIKSSVDKFFEEPAPAAPAASAPSFSAEKSATITKTIVSSSAAIIPGTPVAGIDEGKKDDAKPEINKN